ncbi:imidazole glycerol phosphate synthase subunit HisH [Arcticibacterium luteifluviistationis]|uniref:Imidazole glycerol phosphate synthase subunit HisH n=1 Tax=Arcticibacterium luteifluviistationis TaxID=1784714 RepID=A0A2Z4GA86_9BACT|nr:imidazole glycerol phosphate synthase subunit HisH [Arcticibacterium luteifluviistationis]AWV98116.1 imidazole glycerol phosphate synthase subunit HisH [Arcticibacterium luteifluviistationis]
MADVSIIKYNAGNVMSVMYALDRIGVSYNLTDDPEELSASKRIIFPGVGEASTAMRSLRENGLDKLIPTLKQPFLATCIGMQLLCNYSEEGDTACLGVFDVDIIKFQKKEDHKIPQTGWNNIFDYKSDLLKGIEEGQYVYYNHSFYAPICEDTVATTDYIVPYSAILQKDNFYACQFHSEISGDVGEQIFRNFLKK